jgi:cobalt-zinc-cadmium efflux system protein
MAHDHSHHGHAHHHHGHAHAHGPAHAGNERRVFFAAILTGLFMTAEVAGGLIAGSLALLADAGHMLTDFASLALAWFAFRLSRRPATWKRTYGFDRFQVLVAFVNGVTLAVLSLWIVVEAARRLREPVEVMGGTMAAVAALGLLVNIVAFALLHGADRNNLNIKGATLHVLGDLLGSVAALAAAAIILLTGWMAADPILSVLVALIILRSAVSVVRDSAHILLEAAPRGLDVAAIGPDLEAHIPGVCGVHHVHAWAITSERAMITLHAQTTGFEEAGATTAAIKARLRDRFGLDHVTVELEHGFCADDVQAQQSEACR